MSIDIFYIVYEGNEKKNKLEEQQDYKFWKRQRVAFGATYNNG